MGIGCGDDCVSGLVTDVALDDFYFQPLEAPLVISGFILEAVFIHKRFYEISTDETSLLEIEIEIVRSPT